MLIGIIGSAGRKQDAPLVNRETFLWIVDQVKALVQPSDVLISGGAAFADHAAVVVALERDQQLQLELPAPWDEENHCFVNNEPGRISNYYHRNFSKSCNWPADHSLAELDKAIHSANTKITVVDGFFQRNSLIAQCDRLLAFTFNPPGPNGPSGGTGNTWRKCKADKQLFQIPKIVITEEILGETSPSAWPKPSAAIMSRIDQEYAVSTVYPPKEQIFAALDLCSPSAVKVVILGQDCYHGPNQAHGLAFSTLGKAPPSLVNIFTELKSDLGIERSKPNLTDWAEQGVLLLNCALTVREGKPGSHSAIWESYTDEIISLINQRSKVVFMLWGNHAKRKARLISGRKHLILASGHPSPLSVRLFQGCKHFSKANQWLRENQLDPIKW